MPRNWDRGDGIMSATGPCTDPEHEGANPPLVALDLYELRLERRRLWDLRDRRFRRLIAPICRKCAARYLDDPVPLETLTLFESGGAA